MNIQEMHNTFRTLGQQMGLQLNRGILPESIDVYINDVIIEKTHDELLNGVHTAIQENVNLQATTMSPINAFRSLYRTARYKATDNNASGGWEQGQGIRQYVNKANGYYIFKLPSVDDTDIRLWDGEYRINPMMYLGFSIEYPNTLRGNAVACRMIGADVLETTLRDYCNGASKDAPIVVLSSVPIVDEVSESKSGICNQQIELYTGTKDLDISYINIKYIKVPNVVKFDMDINKCVNCDLPAYTHFDIVERAVVKFQQSIGLIGGQGNTRQQRQ